MLDLFIRKKMLEPDKILHIKYSAAIMLVSYIVLPMVVALVFTFLIGLLKECWDHYYGTGFCFYDMLANIIGILFSIGALKIITFIL
jgi:hypothetical protein